MIVPNLQPGQKKSQRPMSASLRTPRSGRGGDPSFSRLSINDSGCATPRVQPKQVGVELAHT